MKPFEFEKNIDSITIKLSYNNQLYEISTQKDIKINELRKNLFCKFNLNDSFIITYKNQKILKNDFTPLELFLKDDINPILFINDSNTILPNLKTSNTITLSSNLSQQKLLNIINLFFISKNIPFNASIKNTAKGIYDIKFNNSQLSSNFLIFYQNKLGKNNNNNYSNKSAKYFKFITENNNNHFSNQINIKRQLTLPPIKNKIIAKTSSISKIVSQNVKSSSIYNVIKENSKSDFISQKIIESGYNILRQSNIRKNDKKSKKNNAKQNFYKNEKYIDEEYEGIYLCPFMSKEEKYYRDQFLDKKNWLDKSGFIVSVGKYKMKNNNFIPNYVTSTPSEPPLNHKYRDVDKTKWINKNGFIL